jgi:hypothetical protein
MAHLVSPVPVGSRDLVTRYRWLCTACSFGKWRRRPGPSAGSGHSATRSRWSRGSQRRSPARFCIGSCQIGPGEDDHLRDFLARLDQDLGGLAGSRTWTATGREMMLSEANKQLRGLTGTAHVPGAPVDGHRPVQCIAPPPASRDIHQRAVMPDQGPRTRQSAPPATPHAHQ